jgi:hypothetical protein
MDELREHSRGIRGDEYVYKIVAKSERKEKL